VAVTRRAPGFREVSDGAILEISTLEAIRGTQLLGPYSRFGWHHPGPLYFYLLAPWYWMSRFHTTGVQAGALVINLAAMWLIVRTTFAAASLPTAIAVSWFSAWYAFRSDDIIVSAWNPHVIVMPLLAFIVLAAAMVADARRSHLLFLVAVGTFLAQTHLAMVPIVAILGIPAVWTGRRLSRATWALAVGLKLFLWIPPLVEQISHRPGNLVAIASFFVNGGPGQDFATAVSAWASTLTGAFRPGFVIAMGSDYVPASVPLLSAVAIGFLALLAALGVARRRDATFDACLLGMCAAASVVALAATTRIQDHIIDHEIFWVSGIGALSVGAVVGSLVALAGAASRGIAVRAASTTATLAWLAVALTGAIGMRHALERRRTLDDHAVDVLTEQIEKYLATSGARRPRFDIEPPVWPIAAGALLEIDKAGTPFAVGERWATMFGERFTATGQEDGVAQIGGSAVSTSVTPVR
jgi:hypothetical protein